MADSILVLVPHKTLHGTISTLGFQANMEGQPKKVWGALHVSPRTAPSKRAKLCTYFAWFLRPKSVEDCAIF